MNITTIVIALIVFGVIVIVHEMGHFLVAKYFGVTVHEFSVGMGPQLIGKKINGTEYSVRALPLGGYVRMEGEDAESDDPNSFNNKSPLKRMAIIFAGPFMNFVLTIILMSVLFAFTGVPTQTIGALIPDMPAAEAGMMPGDKIISINEEKITSWNQVLSTISQSENETLTIVVNRDNQEKTFQINPVTDQGRKIVGISPANEKSPGLAIYYGFSQTFTMAKDMLVFLGQLVTGRMGTEGVAGPVGIISEVGKAAAYGVSSVVYLAALISLNLGLINLLPIPALDGSRIVFQFIELVRGKKLDPNKEGYVHMIGMILLLALMLVITFKDISKLIQ